MAKIGKLTPEQEAYLPELRQKWLKIGLDTSPIDKERAKQAVENLYQAGGYEKPKVLFFDSPLACILAINSLRNVDGDNLNGNLRYNLEGNLSVNLSDNLGDNLRYNPWKNLKYNLWENLWKNLEGNLKDNLEALYIHTSFWGGQDAFWLAFYDFGEYLGVEYEKDAHFQAYKEYAKSCGWAYLYEGVAFVSDRPEIIKKDDQGRSHCENGPAIKFRDGYSVYVWEGKNVPARWIEEKDTIHPSEILEEKNVELRAIGAKIIGWPKMLEVLEAKVIDDSGNPDIGQLIEFTLPGLEKPGRFLKAICPRNGVIVEGVFRVSDIDGLPINTALAAQAWRAGKPQNNYVHPKKRT